MYSKQFYCLFTEFACVSTAGDVGHFKPLRMIVMLKYFNLHIFCFNNRQQRTTKFLDSFLDTWGKTRCGKETSFENKMPNVWSAIKIQRPHSSQIYFSCWWGKVFNNPRGSLQMRRYPWCSWKLRPVCCVEEHGSRGHDGLRWKIDKKRHALSFYWWET